MPIHAIFTIPPEVTPAPRTDGQVAMDFVLFPAVPYSWQLDMAVLLPGQLVPSFEETSEDVVLTGHYHDFILPEEAELYPSALGGVGVESDA